MVIINSSDTLYDMQITTKCADNMRQTLCIDNAISYLPLPPLVSQCSRALLLTWVKFNTSIAHRRLTLTSSNVTSASPLQRCHMNFMSFQITSNSNVCSAVCSNLHQTNHQSSSVLVLCEGNICRLSVYSLLPELVTHNIPLSWRHCVRARYRPTHHHWSFSHKACSLFFAIQYFATIFKSVTAIIFPISYARLKSYFE